ncbi:MAG: hypothetical protein RIC30_08485 [Marinoscillum sp.]|uniref:hypothetical protein n=1 Tax=Marinoscillum sp. TaxID=2024838 RepID=UPI0032F3445A
MSKINLTEEENELYMQVLSLDPDEDYELRISKLNSQKELAESLLNREAIPEQRINYFTKKEFQTGISRKSRIEEFEAKVNSESDIFSHGHFTKYLQYFIEGANIDPQLNQTLRKIAESNMYDDDKADEIIKYLKSNSVIPTAKQARDEFAEEIFKFGADINLNSSYCHRLRNKIRG